jgi:hypothetical protein
MPSLGSATYIKDLLKDFCKLYTLFLWFSACQNTFQKHKRCFTSVLVLCYFDPEWKVVVKMDTFNLVIAGILSQYDYKGIFYPVAYFLKKH